MTEPTERKDGAVERVGGSEVSVEERRGTGGGARNGGVNDMGPGGTDTVEERPTEDLLRETRSADDLLAGVGKLPEPPEGGKTPNRGSF